MTNQINDFSSMTPSQKQQFDVNLAEVLLGLQSGVDIGHFTSNIEINVKECKAALAKGKKLGIEPDWEGCCDILFTIISGDQIAELSDKTNKKNWKAWITLMEQFVQREGHARVPSKHKEDVKALGVWVAQQRVAFRKNRMSPERRACLEKLPGWKWNLRKPRFK